METQKCKKSFLNIYDELEITIKKFRYKISDKDGKKLDFEYNNDPKESWVVCPTLTGLYCGFGNTGHHFIKPHVTSFPYKMANYGGRLDYIEFNVSAISSILITKK